MPTRIVPTIFVLTCLIITVCGCLQTPEPTASPSPLNSPLGTSTSVGSPLPTGESPQTESDRIETRRFQLDKPILAGSEKVTGSGPPGVPIALLDITFGGRMLASGVIGEQGEFTLTLGEPLEARHRIGLTLGNLSSTRWEADDFSSERFYGDDALSVPQVGFFYDTYVIRD